MAKTITDKQKIKELLERGVEDVIVKEHLEKQLLSGKSIRLYFGIDPTSSLLHLGHSVVLKKLRAFQELGHEVILLIGDFTARIGDPTDKMAARQPLTEQQIKENMKTYKEQASKLLDFSKTSFAYNNQWLGKLNFNDVVQIASNFTVQQMLTRDMFQKRIQQEKPISLHEFLYPLMQGYDSVALDVDLEVAGNDQLFNVLAGRTLQKVYNNKDKDVLTTKLLLGTDGQKMSKSLGNFIALTEKPNEMFGKLMSIKDELISHYIELCTDLKINEQEIKQNPRETKAILAKEIVKMYHTEKKAIEAEKEFTKVFSKKQTPDNIAEFKTSRAEWGVVDLLKESGLVVSKGEAKRLVEGGGVTIITKDSKNVIKSWQEALSLQGDEIIKAGKRRFIKIKITK